MIKFFIFLISFLLHKVYVTCYYVEQINHPNENISSIGNIDSTSKFASFEIYIPNTSLRLKVNLTIQLENLISNRSTIPLTTTTRLPLYNIPNYLQSQNDS